MDFKREDYLNLIHNYLTKGYEVSDLSNIHSKSLIIRHDVDFHLELALKFARFEHQNNLKSHYFVLLTSEFYNCFSKKSALMLREILSLGHCIGLHFDSSIYKFDNLDMLIEKIRFEKKTLESLIEQEIEAITFHRPPKNIFDLPRKIAGMTNLYSRDYFEELNYFSDSRRIFRRDPYNLDESKPIQLLIHPIWFEINESNTSSVLIELQALYLSDFWNNLDENITDLKEIING